MGKLQWVDDADQAWSWISTKVFAFLTVANTAGAALYMAGMLPTKYVGIFLAVNAVVSGSGGVGRVVKQAPQAQGAKV